VEERRGIGHTGIGFGSGLALRLKITFLPEAVSTRKGAIASMEEAKIGSSSNSDCVLFGESSGGGVRSTRRSGTEDLDIGLGKEREAVL
jgi:hypothetical protein